MYEHGGPNRAFLVRGGVVVPAQIRQRTAERKYAIGARPSPLELLAECGMSTDPCVEGDERGSEPGAFFRSSMGEQPSDVSGDVAKEAAVEADRSGQLSATRKPWAP